MKRIRALDRDDWLLGLVVTLAAAALLLGVPTIYLVYRALFACGQLTCP